MAFEDLLWSQGKDNMGGLVGEIFFCPTEDVDEALLPDLNADKISLVGDFAVKSGKTFIRIYHTKGTGKLDDTQVGERDGKSRENLLDWFFPGTERKVEAFKQLVQNTPGVYICKDTDGNQRVVGVSALNSIVGLDLPAYAETISGTSGAASADRRGSTFQVKAEAPHSPLFYPGNVPIIPVIDSVAPLAAAAAGGTELTIEGREFTGVTALDLGGTAMTSFVVVNDRKITCVTPVKAAGSYAVNVTNAYGSRTSADLVVVS